MVFGGFGEDPLKIFIPLKYFKGIPPPLKGWCYQDLLHAVQAAVGDDERWEELRLKAGLFLEFLEDILYFV